MEELCTAETGPVEQAGASLQAIQAHYDVSNEFYALWLDPGMTYSCALWDGVTTLGTAQERKLDLHLQQAHAKGVRRLLDVGCGWGSLLKRAVDHYGVATAVGLTLSEAQLRGSDLDRYPAVEIRLEPWESHMPDEPYDAIVSIGAFEHFVKPGMARADKVAAYRRFFEWCYVNSVDGSWLSLQTIVYESYDERVPNPFVEEIFPESDLPRVSEIADAMRGLYEIVRLRNDRDHYARTLQCWLKNLRTQRSEAIALTDERTYRKYEKYLGVFVVGFHIGTVNLARVAARRI
jgi:cyclopropane-fatty-acyl-phospholipid synthase